MAYPIMAAESTWYKGSVLRSTITEIHIVDSYTPTGNESESWNADEYNSGSIKCYRTGTVLTIAGNGNGKIALSEDSEFLFCDKNGTDLFTSLTTITGANILDTSTVKSFYGAFYGCSKLKTLDVSTWDVSNVMYFSYMFSQCFALETLDVSKWNTSSAIAFNYTFSACDSLVELDVGNWDTSKVKSFEAMFHGQASTVSSDLTVLDVSNWDTSSAENMAYMFWGNKTKLKSVDVSKWDVRKVKDFTQMFAQTYFKLAGDNVKNWVTSSAESLNGMFLSLTNNSLDVSNFDTRNVKYFQQMFEICSGLTEIIGIENFDTANGIYFGEMFRGCSKLQELDLSSFDTRNGTYMKDMLRGTNRLEKVRFGPNFYFEGSGELLEDSPEAAVLPTPSSEYITGADGNWYAFPGVPYVPTDVPSGKAMTYYALKSLIPDGLVTVKNSFFTGLSNQIRNTTGATEQLTPDEMIDSIQCFAGNIAERIEVAFFDGAKSEYDRFWDTFQQGGERTGYDYAFRTGWYDEIFKPKYDIKPTTFSQTFASTGIKDVVKCLKDAGVVLDTSKATGFSYSFYSESLETLPTISTVSTNTLSYSFYNATHLHTIEKLILKDDGSQTFTTAFGMCSRLQNIVIEGSIGNNFGVAQSSQLTYNSASSIIEALKNYSGSGTTHTVTFHTNVKALLTDADKAIITQKGWTLA